MTGNVRKATAHYVIIKQKRSAMGQILTAFSWNKDLKLSIIWNTMETLSKHMLIELFFGKKKKPS